MQLTTYGMFSVDHVALYVAGVNLKWEDLAAGPDDLPMSGDHNAACHNAVTAWCAIWCL
jgi:hypothetical protein